jgi:hypothetical protein
MTQLATARPAPRPGARRSPAPRRLRVVAPPAAAGSGLFLGLCVLLLFGGFVGVLVLNTAMAKGSYTMKDLQRQSDALADTQDDLRHALDAVSGPGPLAQRARELGMVPAQSPAFLRLSDGAVLGVATRARQDKTFSVVTETEATPRKVPVTTPSPAATKPSSASTPTTKAKATTKAKDTTKARAGTTPEGSPSPTTSPSGD